MSLLFSTWVNVLFSEIPPLHVIHMSSSSLRVSVCPCELGLIFCSSLSLLVLFIWHQHRSCQAVKHSLHFSDTTNKGLLLLSAVACCWYMMTYEVKHVNVRLRTGGNQVEVESLHLPTFPSTMSAASCPSLKQQWLTAQRPSDSRVPHPHYALHHPLPLPSLVLRSMGLPWLPCF